MGYADNISSGSKYKVVETIDTCRIFLQIRSNLIARHK